MSLWTTVTVGAQPTVTVDSTVRCAPCRLEFGPVIPLRGGLSDGNLPNLAQAVLRARDGQTYVMFDADYTHFQVHDSTGRFTGRRIGRPGAGPGEFGAISALDARLIGDTLRLHDAARLRRTDLDRRTGNVIRTIGGVPPGHAESIVEPGGQRVVFAGALSTRTTAGYPLHAYSASSSGFVWSRSFGAAEAALRPGAAALLYRTLESANGERFWAGYPNEYRIELWDYEGKLASTLLAPRSWFPRWTQQVIRSREVPPHARVRKLSFDARTQLLYVLLQVPHDRWAEALSEERDPMGNRMITPGRPYVVSLLEVIDPTSGQVVLRHRFPIDLWGFAAPDALWRTWIDADSGQPRAEVIPFRLVGR